jgi:hypothetical protein
MDRRNEGGDFQTSRRASPETQWGDIVTDDEYSQR